MANFSCTISGTVTGLVGGNYTIPSFTYSNASSPGLADLVTTSGTTAQALTVPTNTLFVMFVPPAGNTTEIRVSGTGGGATGILLHPTNPTILALPSSSPEVTIRTGATITNIQVYWL